MNYTPIYPLLLPHDPYMPKSGWVVTPNSKEWRHWLCSMMFRAACPRRDVNQTAVWSIGWRYCTDNLWTTALLQYHDQLFWSKCGGSKTTKETKRRFMGTTCRCHHQGVNWAIFGLSSRCRRVFQVKRALCLAYRSLWFWSVLVWVENTSQRSQI